MNSNISTRMQVLAVTVVAMLLAFALAKSSFAQAPSATDTAPSVDSANLSSGVGTNQIAEEYPIPTRSLLEMLVAGGPLLIPIVLASFVLVLVVFERTISLRRGRVLPKPFVKRLLLQLREGQIDRKEALERCEENSSYIAQVFGAAVRKWGRPAVEVEQAVLDEGERVANVLRRYLRVINGVATVTPLLGLLGTVWGMMTAFNAIATSSAMGKPEQLASGISQALLTTAAGLFVAIPALILYMFFVGKVDQLVMDIDSRGQELVNEISAEAIQEKKSGRSSETSGKSNKSKSKAA